MNPTILFKVLKKQIILLTILILLSIAIWYRGPELIVFGKIPFSSKEDRFYGIAFITLCWLLKFILLDTRKNQAGSVKESLFKETQKKLDYLQGRFLGAIEFLKKTVIHKHERNVNLLSLPWYLMIGPKSAGKTTLLANANINFILAKQFKSQRPKSITPSDICDWWVTRDLVLVDIPGAYITSNKNSTPSITSMHQTLWKRFFSLLRQFRHPHGIAGIIIGLNLPEIVKYPRQEKNRIIYDMKKHINELLNSFGKQLPVHLIITKCDLLPGFCEFFSELSTDEISQAWGVTIPPINEGESVTGVFTHRFNALIKRLNKQLMTRLHQERNPNARPYIKDFPLHIEQLKEGIIQFLKGLMIPKLQLQSVYLTSGTQSTEDNEENAILSGNPFNTQSLQILSAPTMPTRAYFIRQLILQHLLASQLSEQPKKIKNPVWQRRIMYGTSIGAIIAASILLGRDFKQGVMQAYAIQNNLAEYQLRMKQSTDPGEHLTKEALSLLNELRKAEGQRSDTLSLAFYSNKSRETAQKIYHQALESIVIPEIKNYLEQYLQDASNNNPENIYPILKAYLMLNDKEHFQPDFIAQTLQQLMPNGIDKEVIVSLGSHIHSALTTTKLSIRLNSSLILKVRNDLMSLPKCDLAFVLLKNKENNNRGEPIALGTQSSNPPVFISKAIDTKVPGMFTGKLFQKILTEELGEVIRQAYEGNWVLGNNPIESNDAEVAALAKQLRSQYISHYIDIWESLLANLELQIPERLSELNTMIGNLVSNDSPLLQLLDTIKQNTAFQPILAGSPKLQNLSMLLTDANHNQNSILYEDFVSLNELHSYLKGILNTPDPQKSIFDATKNRMQAASEDSIIRLKTIALKNPEPLKSWLNMIAAETWDNLLQETGRYIEDSYRTDVLEPYRATIANRFPFNQAAEKEVSIAHFIAFLGQPGAFTTFYQTYLKPFILEGEKKWEWRTMDSKKIPLSDKVLEQFGRAIRLQHAFFPNGDNKLYVPFSIQPFSMGKDMKNVTLTINGQELAFDKTTQKTPRSLTWPGNSPIHHTAIQFSTDNNQLINNTIKGDWGWFRLVNHSTEAIRSRKELLLSFQVEGHTAKYLLFTQGKLNPFLPLNFSRFELPDQLV